MKISACGRGLVMVFFALWGNLSPAKAQFSTAIPPAPKPTVAVAGFSVAKNIARDAGDKFTVIAETAFRDSGQYRMAARPSLEKNVGALLSGDAGFIAEESRRKIAQSRAADFLVSGLIRRLIAGRPLGQQNIEVGATVNVTIVDVASGAVVYQREYRETGSDPDRNIGKATDAAFAKIGDRFKADLQRFFPLGGNVIQFVPESGRVVIDKGAKDGVSKNSYFEFSLITEIVDDNGQKRIVQETLPFRARPVQGTRGGPDDITKLEFGTYSKGQTVLVNGVQWRESRPDALKLKAFIERWKKEHPGKTPQIVVRTIQPPDR